MSLTLAVIYCARHSSDTNIEMKEKSYTKPINQYSTIVVWVSHKPPGIVHAIVAVWRSGSALVFINEVNLRRVRLVLG